MNVVESKLQALSAIATGVVAGLGFIAPWPLVVTGMFFAIAGGFAGMVVSPPAERMSLFATLFVALVIGTFAGLAHPHVDSVPVISVLADLPLQLVMGGAGLCSRWITRRMAEGEIALWKGKETRK